MPRESAPIAHDHGFDVADGDFANVSSPTNGQLIKYNSTTGKWENTSDVILDSLDLNNGVALGGGAAPTLGTIGGSGPTTAAQAQWLEIDIGGTPHWIAVWT